MEGADEGTTADPFGLDRFPDRPHSADRIERGAVAPVPVEDDSSARSVQSLGPPYRRDPRVENVPGYGSVSSNSSHAASLARNLDELDLSGSDDRTSVPNSVHSNFDPNAFDPRMLEYMATLGARAALQQQNAEKPTHGFVRSTTSLPQLGVTGIAAPSGLEMRPVARNDTQLSSAGVISRHDRGHTESDRLKHKRGVVVSLSDKFTLSKVFSIVTSDDLDKLNIALECISYQACLRGFRVHLENHDMLPPFMIPANFDIETGTFSGEFISLLDHYNQILPELDGDEGLEAYIFSPVDCDEAIREPPRFVVGQKVQACVEC